MNQPDGADRAAFLERVRAKEGSAGRSNRLKALGRIVKIIRARDGKSIEKAAKDAGLGHMTWRRIEEGTQVRAQTYAALDRRFELPSGTILNAIANDSRMVELAASLRVGAGDDSKRVDDREFVAALAGPDATPVEGDQVIAVAKVEIKDGVEMSTGVGPLVKAAPLSLVMGALVNRLSEDPSSLTREEMQVLKAALDLMIAKSWTTS